MSNKDNRICLIQDKQNIMWSILRSRYNGYANCFSDKIRIVEKSFYHIASYNKQN